MTLQQKKPLDMLHGSIWNKIPQFALPVAATAILEQLFNASDIAVVGNFTGAIRTVAVAAARNHFLHSDSITQEKLSMIRELNEIAAERSQSLAEMALCWVLRENRVTTVLIGASRKEQISNNVKIVDHLDFTGEELARIEAVLSKR